MQLAIRALRVVVTLAQVMEALRLGAGLYAWSSTGGDPYDWLTDRKNRRTIPHRFEFCGYVPVRNSSAESGLWLTAGKLANGLTGERTSRRPQPLAAAEALKAGVST